MVGLGTDIGYVANYANHTEEPGTAAPAGGWWSGVRGVVRPKF